MPRGGQTTEGKMNTFKFREINSRLSDGSVPINKIPVLAQVGVLLLLSTMSGETILK